ncbi:unnamed protein product [Dracunculus medinensis]|uniref:Uncharacterized protein n=1 Tax=Dracunculus medinensis TaxID=318479 RepID=A0A0N4U3L1_DRAME|nr:unnamed protein product [Dracunculus medinensis]
MDNVFEEFLDFPVESLENLETFNSLNEFEQDLLKNESKLCEELRKLDKIIEHEESQKRLPSGKAREKNLAQLCAKKDLSSSGTTVNLSSKTLPADILQSQCLSHSFLSRFTKTNPLKAYKVNDF